MSVGATPDFYPANTAERLVTPAKFTIEHYERMAELGAFDGENQKRVELIEGEIVEMSPIGTPHRNMVAALNEWSFGVIDLTTVRVQVQDSIRLAALVSEPEPDIVWSVRRRYTTPPLPEDVRLLIEVADSSLACDRLKKGELYAKVGIADYWIVNLKDKQVEVYRGPQASGSYATTSIHGVDQPGPSPLCLPEATLDVAALFAESN